MFLLSGLQKSIGVHDKFYWRLFRRPGTRIAFLRAQRKHGLLFQTSWQQQTAFPDFKFLPHGNCTGSKFQPNTLPRVFFFFFPYSLKKSLLPILTKGMKSSQNFLMNDPSFGEHILKRHVCYFSVKTTELYVLNIPGPHLGFRMQEGGHLTVPGTF